MGILIYFNEKSEATPAALLMIGLRYLALRQLASQGASAAVSATASAVANLGTKQVIKLASGILF
jgi:hypothetical protein